jgi:hypothetical protein
MTTPRCRDQTERRANQQHQSYYETNQIRLHDSSPSKLAFDSFAVR